MSMQQEGAGGADERRPLFICGGDRTILKVEELNSIVNVFSLVFGNGIPLTKEYRMRHKIAKTASHVMESLMC